MSLRVREDTYIHLHISIYVYIYIYIYIYISAHERSRHDVCSLDGDTDGEAHPRVSDEVCLAAADARAAEDVHTVLHNLHTQRTLG